MLTILLLFRVNFFTFTNFRSKILYKNSGEDCKLTEKVLTLNGDPTKDKA